jgi:hypothetical protein
VGMLAVVPHVVLSGGTQAPLQSIPDTHWHTPP